MDNDEINTLSQPKEVVSANQNDILTFTADKLEQILSKILLEKDSIF